MRFAFRARVRPGLLAALIVCVAAPGGGMTAPAGPAPRAGEQRPATRPNAAEQPPVTRPAVSEQAQAARPTASEHAQATRPDAGGAPRKVFTLERIHADPPFAGKPPQSIRWMPDSRGISYLESAGEAEEKETRLVVKEVPSGRTRTLCVVDTIRVPEDLRKDDETRFEIGSYTWAEKAPVMIFAFKDDVFTFDAKTLTVARRTRTPDKEANLTLSPVAEYAAFTRKNDLYAVDLVTNAETRLTTTGSDSLLNGVLDWVYMEELFTRGDMQGYWWSPDGRAIAYLQFDERPVKRFPIVDFLPLYNRAETQAYPKAGERNPIVRLGVHHLEGRPPREAVTGEPTGGGQTVWMSIDTTDDSYIARVYWLGDGKRLAVEKLNRDQDELALFFADAASGEMNEVLREKSDTWVDVSYMKHYYRKKNIFVWSSERDGHAHLYLYTNEGKLLDAVTSGAWDVHSLDHVDEKRGEVFFTAVGDPILERHVYRVSERGGEPKRLSDRTGTHAATFSPDSRHYIDRFSNTTTPSVISVHDADGKRVFTLHESDAAELASYELSAPEFFTITSRSGLQFHCSMIKPRDFDPSKKYPVLVYTYGGPGGQVVRNVWGGETYLWHAYMAARGYLVFSLDNRGSYGRGHEWQEPLLRSMGKVELEDQLAGVEYLKSLPYVDGSRIGIWGWSYGGYMTCTAMFKAPGVFRAGAAVAPVTDWRFYDSIYTERYMKLPKDNQEGYDESAPIRFVEDLQAPFLLLHGTSDDNVHMANTLALADALVKAGKDFDLMLYPGKAHGISGKAHRRHLYRRLTRFFDAHLLPEPPKEPESPAYEVGKESDGAED